MVIDKSKLKKDFTLTFHTGAMHTKDNSLSFVKKAVEKNAQILELDISFRPDGTPVMIHKGEPTAKEGELLEEAFAVIEKSECMINLDLKSTLNLPALEAVLKKYNLFDRVFYTGVMDEWTSIVRKNSSIPYYLNHSITKEQSKDRSEAKKVAEKAKSLGCIGINSNFNGASKLFCDVMHEEGLSVSLWTVKEKSDMKKVYAYGPDNITTTKPMSLYPLIVKK